MRNWLVIISILYLVSCNSIRHRSFEKKYYTTKTIYIENANLIGQEIDTGKCIIYKYERSYNEPNTVDEEHSTSIFIKVKSSEDLPIGKKILIPGNSVLVSGYFWSVWSSSEPKNITGSITRLKDGMELDLTYSRKGKIEKLLDGTFTFTNCKDYFRQNYIDYNGTYNNLRIALKEPDKVKILELNFREIYKFQKYTNGQARLELPSEIGSFKNLEELNLYLSDLEKLPIEIGNLNNIKVLNLGYTDFKFFPLEIIPLVNLEYLNLEYAHLIEVPTQIKELEKLRNLNLDYNRFLGFPISITKLKNLENLSIKGDSVTTIPVEIQNLQKLKILNLSSFWNYRGRNHLQNLEVLVGLKNLEELYLDCSHIIKLPDEFSQFESLKILSIKENEFKIFPEVIDRIPRLNRLIISPAQFDEKVMAKLKEKKYEVVIEN